MTFAGVAAVAGALILLTSSASTAAGEAFSPDQSFEQGRNLMHEGRFAEASRKFAESEALEPTPVTLLNLALCHEKLGQLGSTLLELREVIEEAGSDVELAKLANKHIRAIAAEVEKTPLPSIKIVVEPAAASQGARVSIDGIWLRSALLSGAIPADVGPHVVLARDARDRSRGITVRTHDLAIEEVKVVFDEADGPRVTTAPSGLKPPRPPPPRFAPVFLLAVGGACLIGAGVTGLIAHQDRATFIKKNTDPNATTGDRASAHDTAEHWRWANLALVVGTAASAAAAVLLYTRRPSETQATLAPVVRRDAIGFAFTMRWGVP